MSKPKTVPTPSLPQQSSLQTVSKLKESYRNHTQPSSNIKGKAHIYNLSGNSPAYPQQISNNQFQQKNKRSITSTNLTTQKYQVFPQEQCKDIKNETYAANTNNRIEKSNGKFRIADVIQKDGKVIDRQQRKSLFSGQRIIHQSKPHQVPHNKMRSQSIKNMISNSSISKYESKYNIYSCLDEPYERVKKSGCNGISCPINECIASQIKYSWFK